MLKVCSNHSIVQYVDYMRGAHQRGGPGAVALFAPYKIHHCSNKLVLLPKPFFNNLFAEGKEKIIAFSRVESCQKILTSNSLCIRVLRIRLRSKSKQGHQEPGYWSRLRKEFENFHRS